MSIIHKLLVAGIFLINLTALAQSRPPQFVILAFDGSKSLGMWSETIDFASEARKKLKQDLKFTYFISGVYFLANEYRNHYEEPTHGSGSSAIGFGGSKDDVVSRVRKINMATDDAHEIASHANGHYDGTAWSEDNWNSEFDQFTDLVFNFSINNVLEVFDAIKIKSEQILGFRAPLLGTNKELWTAQQSHGILYDTSLINKMDYWPRKNSHGIWNFPLASVVIAGSGKKTISMDYNFYYAQSQAAEADEDLLPGYQQEMYDTYMNYFLNNYNGNRAPLNIGHHFSKWNKGIYWQALKDFAMDVCGLPEVRCVTYTELMDYMNGLKDETIDAYQAGQFEKALAYVPENIPASPLSVSMNWQVTSSNKLFLRVEGPDREILLKNNSRLKVRFNEHTLQVQKTDLGEYFVDTKGLNLVGPQKLQTSIIQDGRELLHSSRYLFNNKGQIVIASDDIEDYYSQMGDLPEAHIDEPNH